LHQIAHGGVSKRTGLKLFGREITVPKRHRQTNGQTTCNLHALCIASRGKNVPFSTQKSKKISAEVHGPRPRYLGRGYPLPTFLYAFGASIYMYRRSVTTVNCALEEHLLTYLPLSALDHIPDPPLAVLGFGVAL